MANHKSTKKSIRQVARRKVINSDRRNRIRTLIKAVEAAIAEKNKDVAVTAFKGAQSELMRGVTKGVYKLTTASRKLSRLSARIKALPGKFAA